MFILRAWVIVAIGVLCFSVPAFAPQKPRSCFGWLRSVLGRSSKQTGKSFARAVQEATAAQQRGSQRQPRKREALAEYHARMVKKYPTEPVIVQHRSRKMDSFTGRISRQGDQVIFMSETGATTNLTDRKSLRGVVEWSLSLPNGSLIQSVEALLKHMGDIRHLA